MHFRSVFIAFSVWLLFLPAAVAQKRVLSTVNPNVDTYDGSADIYVPSSGSFVTAANGLIEPREDHTAVALSDGRVLIAGGQNDHYLKTAEIFDPSTGTFSRNYKTITSPVTGMLTSTPGNMGTARSGAAGVLLPDSTVLIVGGFNGIYVSSAEVYNPKNGVFGLGVAMTAPRYHPEATLMNDGTVLVTGGSNTAFLASSEIYNPYTRSFTAAANMSEAREGHTSTLLNDGTVLIVGGCANTDANKIVCDKYLSSAEIYDPLTGTFETTGSLNQARAEHTASLLPDGRVLIAGGTDGNASLASAEIYDPATGAFTYTHSMGVQRKGHTAAPLQDGRILIAGGYSEGYLDSAEIFDPSSETFSPVASPMSVARYHHKATALRDGRVLFTGGLNSDPLVFDVNVRSTADNVSPNLAFSSDSQVGFVSYTGSGVVAAFSTATGEVIKRIDTGGSPALLTPLADGDGLAAVSVLDNRIFIISRSSMSLESTYTFSNAAFGFGSHLVLSPDGSKGYISSTGTGEVIKFDMATGNELGRLTGLETPAQITVTPDGDTLLVVDTTSTEVYFVNAASMSTKSQMTPRDQYSLAGFTIYNKAVLDAEGNYGIICSWDIDAATNNAVFYFNASTGEIVNTYLVGDKPAFTTLTPDGEQWIVLGNGGVFLIPVTDVGSMSTVAVPGTPLGSANIVFSADSRYAFFSSSSQDQVLQFDLETKSVVGAFTVGDISSSSDDQPAGIGISPDGRTIAVIDYESNQLDLLVDATMLKAPEFVNDRNDFTGITVINLSDNPAHLTFQIFNDSGNNTFKLSDGTTSATYPVTLDPLPPKGQFSLDLSQVVDFDNTQLNEGHLEITSDQPEVVGFAVTGSMGTVFLDTHLTGMNGMTLQRFPDRLHDWIAPDLSLEELQGDAPSSDFVFTNPNYNNTNYKVIHYGADGSQLEGKTDGVLSSAQRDSETQATLFDTTLVNSVLITGGRNGTALNTTELFVTDGSTFQSFNIMDGARYGHAASLMSNGEVLITGGRDGVHVLNSAEVYNPIDKTFSPVIGTMLQPRYRHTSTALNDGTVLITGGQNSVSINATAEIYDPVSKTFRATAGAMNSARDAHTATLLNDGRVLLVGGINGFGLSATAEIYNPVTSTFSPTGSMSTGRAFHKAVLLHDGRVLVTGGYNGTYLSSAEIYDPGTGTFTEIPSMNVARSDHTATVLQDGSVLITGGVNSSGVLNSAELYYPSANEFASILVSMTEPRTLHTATLLSNGRVLIVGGTDGDSVVKYSEMYYPDSKSFSELITTQTAQSEHTATLLRGLVSGYLRGSSDEGVMFRQKSGANTRRVAVDGVNVDKFAGVTSSYAPYFITKSPSRTVLNLINANEDKDATVTVTLHGFDGGVVGAPVSLLIPINQQVKKDLVSLFQNSPEVVEQEGWIEVDSSVDRVVGTVSFGKIGGNILATFELSTSPLNEFIIPLSSENADYSTELSLLNAGGQSAAVQIELWGESGVLDASTQIAISPGAAVDGTLSQYFSTGFPRLYGYLRVVSSQPLHAYSTLWGLNQGFACSMPPIPIPAQ